MADKIGSVKGSNIKVVGKRELYEQLDEGQLFFCLKPDVDDATNTQSVVAHVGFIWLVGITWITIESTIATGVRIGKLMDYVDNYPSDLVIAKIQGARGMDLCEALNAGMLLMDVRYEWETEEAPPPLRLSCAELIYEMLRNTNIPLRFALGAEKILPCNIYLDQKVVPLCAKLYQP